MEEEVVGGREGKEIKETRVGHRYKVDTLNEVR